MCVWGGGGSHSIGTVLVNCEMKNEELMQEQNLNTTGAS